MQRLRAGILAVLMAGLAPGCVGYDTMGIRPTGDLPVSGLSGEQTGQLKSAADWGEPSLIATAARMAWESPEHAESLANYAANLMPEKSAEILAAVRHSSRP
ncbi:MAG: hypothetical protein WEC73_03805 [Chthoniobacterales bacterium]